MELNKLGWEKFSQNFPEEINEQSVARVAVENRGSYLLYSVWGELEGIVQGKFHKNAQSEADYPKVGDWVLMEKLQGEQKAVIKSVLPRTSKLSRKRISKDRSEIHQKQEEQIIAANVDLVFIVQGLDGDYNLERLERYVQAAEKGECEPVVLLNKCDIAEDAQQKLEQVQAKFPEVKTFLVSAKLQQGLNEIQKIILPQTTVVFVGSSGVGKSTLINALLGIDLQKTGEIRLDDSRGRHTTTRREMILLENGGILIDTPGMRELAVVDEQSIFEKERSIRRAKAFAKQNRKRTPSGI